MDALGPALQVFEEMRIGPGQEGLQLQCNDFIKERGPPSRVQVRSNFIQQQYRVWG